jgi:hypothetical protein
MESSKLEVDFCGRAKLEILRLAGGPWALARQDCVVPAELPVNHHYQHQDQAL